MTIITTLLAVVFALCLRDTLALNVVLEATNVDVRGQWGANDVLLTCSSTDGILMEPILHATFTRDQEPINVSNDGACTPAGDQYCYVQNGELLSFTANSATEGKYACIHENQASNELAIVGKCVLLLFCDVAIYKYYA